MKKVLTILFFIFLYFKVSGQLKLTPLKDSQKAQDSIIERYHFFEKQIPEYYQNVRPKGNWTIYNVNYLDINNYKSLDFLMSKFFVNLGNPSLMYFLIDTAIAKQTDIFCLPQVGSNELLFPNDFYHLPPSFIEDLKYLGSHYDLGKISLFIIPPLPELYIYLDNNVYIIDNNKIFPAMPYLKKKYKNKKGFIEKFKVY